MRKILLVIVAMAMLCSGGYAIVIGMSYIDTPLKNPIEVLNEMPVYPARTHVAFSYNGALVTVPSLPAATQMALPTFEPSSVDALKTAPEAARLSFQTLDTPTQVVDFYHRWLRDNQWRPVGSGLSTTQTPEFASALQWLEKGIGPVTGLELTTIPPFHLPWIGLERAQRSDYRMEISTYQRRNEPNQVTITTYRMR